MTFFPQLNWYVGHKIELLTNIYYFLFVVLFAFSVLKLRPGKGLVTGAGAVYLVEDVTYFSHIFYLRAYLMILLAFCNALVLTIGHARTERSLSEAQRREFEIAEENAMLEKMNRLRGDFMRDIAHEMKTPLTVMSGYAQLTERQIQKDAVNEETVANLDTIAREARRLSDMVTQLLDVTYHGSEGKNSIFTPAELLEDVAAVCRPVLLKNKNRLETICQTQHTITANKESLLQVLINLCINSNKHTNGGTVIVCVDDAKDDVVAFTVSDNGSGIADEDLPHIFERGYSRDGGNGLGLTICRDIIESAVGGSTHPQRKSLLMRLPNILRFPPPDHHEAGDYRL